MLASAVRKPEAELRSALDRLILAGLLFRQGDPPDASYRFKHALVQDAAYGMLVREQRRTFHARIAETLETPQFAEIAESRPELLARHCTEAGLIEKAAGLWGRAGQRSLARSALLEAAEQLNRALALIDALPGTPALRREEIKLRVGFANALMHVKSYSAPETKASFERARMSIERSEALGEPIEDPLVLFSVLYGFWVASVMAFDGDVMRDLAAQFMELAEKQGAKVPLMVGRRLMGTSLLCTGDIAQGRAHYDHAPRTLRSCRASPSCDPFWARRRGGDPLLSVDSTMDARLSRSRPRRRRTRARRCARDRPRRHFDVRAVDYVLYSSPVRTIRGRENAMR